MSEPTNKDNEVVIAERGDQRFAIPKHISLERSFSSCEAFANQQLDTAGSTFVTSSLRGHEGREVRIPKQHWAEVQPLIRSVKIQPPPPPSTVISDIVKTIIWAVVSMAVVIFLKVNVSRGKAIVCVLPSYEPLFLAFYDNITGPTHLRNVKRVTENLHSVIG
ncbi:hypothetical protein IW261DRAFT_1421191 [Armillaria novae-zelandiae]|uniref:Uncharacterized protein n=1 Tax=Armillaria novae-zelandiae TaxID=153914 RepID=A0AA39P3N5_9AGAR|nr:hypothetical protein IW261DRAFT_1421191 [Armillaria novae-zelandiae]